MNQDAILRLLRILRPHDPETAIIRVGGEGDGGYLMPDDLEGIRQAICIGVGADVSFDLDLATRGIRVAQYDHTVEGPPVVHDLFTFRPLAWAAATTPSSRDLRTMVSENDAQGGGDLLLKFDVEGAEWAALSTVTSGLLARFRIIVCEFHGLGSLDEPGQFARVASALERLSLTHVCTHVHANNCCGVALVSGVPVPHVLEVTFLRRDRSEFSAYCGPLPKPADRPCLPHRPDIILTAWASP